MDYTKDKLQAMKRADLQKLCKKYGIRANMKTEKMVEALSKYSKPTNLEKEENNLPSTCPSNEGVVKEPATNEEIKDDAKEVKGPQNISEKKETNPTAKRKSGSKVKKPVKAASNIPRLDQKQNGKKVNCKTPTTNTNGKSKTPKQNEAKDWSKIHQKQFDNMDSLDVYLTKKRKRAEELGSAAKKVKVLTKEVIQRPNPGAPKPVLAKSKSTDTVVTPKPKETLINKRLTFNFFPSTKESAVQTPGAGKRRATLNDAAYKPATPFRVTSNTMPFGSPTPKKKFNLQASLAKPLRYKPHKGKLLTPPYAKHTPKVVSVKKTPAVKTHQRDVKAVKTKTRNERRERQMKSQSRARESAVSRRRGLIN